MDDCSWPNRLGWHRRAMNRTKLTVTRFLGDAVWLTLLVVTLFDFQNALAQGTPTRKCCDVNACFQDSNSAKRFEDAHNCRLCNPCTRAVERLQDLPRTEGDPTNGFVQNQTCIAKKSCASKKSMQNPRWLDDVVEDFVEPFLDRTDEWNAVIKKCRDRQTWVPFRDELCQQEMAAYHISADLQNSLNGNGCGTDSDWKVVGQIITECIEEGLNSYWPVARQFAEWYANRIVQRDRDSVRTKCIEHRRQRGLPMEENP